MGYARMPAAVLGVLALAALPAGAGAKTIHVNVTWEGNGTMDRSYDQTVDGGNCNVQTFASDNSKFHWKVQWKRVPINLEKKTDAVTRNQSRDLNPTARITGTYYVASNFNNGCASPPQHEDCNKTIKFGTRNNPHDETLIISRPKKGRPRYEFFFDAQSGLSGDPYDCRDAPFGGDVGGYLWDNWSAANPPTPFEPGALSAYTFIPVSVLRENGKVIDNVTSKQVLAPPGQNFNCAKDGFGVTCSVSQKWLGHFTIQWTK